MGFGAWIGGAAKGVAEGLATPFSNAFVASKNNATEQHRITKQTEQAITIANWQADVQLGLAQQLLALADKAHWSTRWMRPAFGGLAFVWVAAEILIWLGVLTRPAVEIDPVVKYLLAGIVGSLFLLRPLEKNKRAELAASVTKAPPKPLLRLINKREDAQ